MKAAPFNTRLFEMNSNIEHIQWPPLPINMNATLATLLYQMDASQWQSAQELQSKQFSELRSLASYAYTHSPFFKKRMDDAQLKPADLTGPEALQKLAPLTRSQLQQVGEALHCAQVPPTHLPIGEGKSSGSTGQPVIIKKTAINSMLWYANMMREHFWHKRDFSEKLINIRASITELSPQKGWGPPVDMIYRSGDSLGVPVTFNARELVRIIREFAPANLVTYPNTLDSIVTLCEKEQINIPSLRHIWSIGETLKPALRERVKKHFGLTIEDDYSCNEIGIMALQCPQTGLFHIMSESVLVEVVDEHGVACVPGQIGKVLVTDLHNFATPMIRYDIGDLAEMGAPCPCGRGLPTLNAIKGRNRGLVTKPDGSRHWPPITPNVMAANLPVLQFQLIQHTLEEIEVRLVVETPLSAAQEDKLREHILVALDHHFSLPFTYFEGKLPQPANGKFEEFISRL